MNMMDRGKYSGDNWAILTPVEQKEVEKQGFSFLQSDKIYCDNCNKALVEIVKVKETEEVNAIRAICPHCNDKSFWFKIKGKIYMQAEEGLYVDDIPMEIKNGITYSTLIVKKDK